MKLYPFQVDGVRFLLSDRRRYLADEMGLGKAVQAVAAAERLQPDSTLVIAPASTLENWRREWRDWGPKRRPTFATVSYSKLLREPVDGRDWDLVIMDEAHYAKSKDAKRTIAALDAARKARRAWLLSGTPMPNHPGELWCPIRALWPEVPARLGLRDHRAWFNHFCRWAPTQYGRKVYGVKNGSELRPFLDRIMLRRKVDDVALDLPPLRIDVSLLPQDTAFAAALEELGVDPDRLESRIAFEEADEDGSVSRLRRLMGEYKAPRIAKIIRRELDDREYQKIVVLAYHRDVIRRLAEAFEPYGVVGFHGGTPQAKRQRAIDTFTEDPSARVFLGQQTAAGIGINLQIAHEIVLVEPAWTPDDNAQAIKRVHRIGSDRPVRARVFGVAGSLDEAIMRTAATKARIQTKVGL